MRCSGALKMVFTGGAGMLCDPTRQSMGSRPQFGSLAPLTGSPQAVRNSWRRPASLNELLVIRAAG